ncbi:MAG TPA: PQQ-dependent catabolism-associated beta-propeller protein [Stellaceae bacterium]|jgi:PQQ-dependent catabolism-associated beta-propeller protein|nr:PQQ-dependent catabolism-associated beta-propeller protein [Stellaceae bacterium]
MMKQGAGPLAALALAALLALAAGARAAGTDRIFVSNERGDALTVLNAKDYALEGEVKTPHRPRGMLFSPDHKKLYVACGGSDLIAVVDVASLKVVDRIGKISDPETFDLDASGRHLYISNEEDAELTVLDLATKQAVGHYPVGLEPEGVLLNHDGSVVYVAAEGSNLVHAIALPGGKRTDIPTGTRPRRFALTPDGKELWVSTELAAQVDVIDTATNRVTAKIDFLPPGMRKEDVSPVGLVMDRAGKTAYVTLGRADNVAVVDIASRKVERYLLVGRRPWGITFDRAQQRLFVANGGSDDISIIDVAAEKVLKSVPVGHYPYGVAVDD